MNEPTSAPGANGPGAEERSTAEGEAGSIELKAMRAELEVARKLHWLAANDYVFLSSYNEAARKHDDGSYPAICCNDIFVPGADAESLPSHELDAYVTLCCEFDDAAAPAWCAAKRNMKPWRNFKLDEAAVERAQVLIAEASAAGANARGATDE